MIHYFQSENANSVFKIQGEGAYVYSKLTHTYERCNLYAEILTQKQKYHEIDEREAKRLIHQLEGEEVSLARHQNMKLHKAIAFASVAHAGQYRKGTNIPYIVHPFEVAQILSEAGAEEDIICAGLLHDIIEDTSYTATDLEKEFGKRVSELVLACTQECEGCWEQRKQHYLDYLTREATLDTMMISCADKLANIRSSKENYEKEGERFWGRFNRGKEGHSWYFSKLIDAFAPLQNYNMFWELNAIYKELFVVCYQGENVLYQTNGWETYVYRKESEKWVLENLSQAELEKQPLQKIDENEMRRIVMKWEMED